MELEAVMVSFWKSIDFDDDFLFRVMSCCAAGGFVDRSGKGGFEIQFQFNLKFCCPSQTPGATERSGAIYLSCFERWL